MTERGELDRMSSKELHDRAVDLAKHRLDVGFLWDLLKAIPEAEAATGDFDRASIDVLRPLALLNDLFDADEGALADALRPLYIDYLEEHEGRSEGDGTPDAG